MLESMLERHKRRNGQVIVIATFSLVILGLLAALTIDVGHMFTAQAKFQNAGDAASMAAIHELISQRLNGSSESQARAAAESEAQAIASLNVPQSRCEVAFGNYNPTTDSFSSKDADVAANAARTRVIRDGEGGSERVSLFFASLAGINQVDMAQNATTRGSNSVIGIKGNSGLRPFGIPESSIGDWDVGDTITVPVPSHTSSGKGSTDEDLMAPGNWGWLDFSGGSRGVPELRSWIDEGYDDDVILDTTDDDGRKCTFVEGSPGLRSTLQSNIDGLVGEEIVVTIFDDVTEQGANAEFRIVGFLGIKITDTNWGHGAQDGELKAEMLGISDNPDAIPGTSGGSEESNIVKIQLVQ